MARGLREAGWDPVVVLAQDGPLAGDLVGAGVEVLVRPLAVLRRSDLGPAGLARLPAAWARDARWLAALARRRGAALVHTNTSVTLGGAPAARLAGVPHVWHVRESWERFGAAWRAYRRVLLTADALPCVSRATAAQLGHTGGRACVLPDGLAVVPRRAQPDRARAALGVPSGAFCVALLGRLADWKGQDVLIRALAEPPLRERQGIALLAGTSWDQDAGHERRLLDLAGSLDVGSGVRLLGFRDDLDTVLGAADCVAVPSTRPDPLPNSALEAAAAGCCVVASAVGGLPEILRDGATGVLVPPGDHRALAGALAALADDPERRRALGAAAAADVSARFAPGALIERLLDLYERVLVQRR